MTDDVVRISFALPRGIRHEFDIRATQEGITMSDVLRIAVLAFIEAGTVDFWDAANLENWLERYRLEVARRQQGGEEG